MTTFVPSQESNQSIVPVNLSSYIDESHTNYAALKAASKNLQNVAQDIQDYTKAMVRLAKRNYKKKSTGLLGKTQDSVRNMSRVKMAVA
jgi:hypothetical protein